VDDEIGGPLAAELVGQGFEIAERSVLRLLHQLGYSLQANAEVVEGAQHADRDGQFAYLNRLAGEAIASGEPVISVDTKKKELIGNHAKRGQRMGTAGRACPHQRA
jgi:hypothetical protein